MSETPPLVAPRDDLQAMRGYHSAQVDVDVRLNTNESPLPPPPEWRAELAAAIAELDWHRYPDRAATALRSAIAGLHGVDPAQVFVANGSNEVLQTLLLAYGGPNRQALVFEPTYQMHSQIARVTGTDVVRAWRGHDFRISADAARQEVVTADPDVVFLCSPNNPTGLPEDPAVVDTVLEVARGLVVVDEAYAQFAPWSALERVSDDNRLVVTRTFSKTWSMAAARLGYLIGPRWVIEQLEIAVLPYHLDAVKQLAGTLALAHVDEMEARVATLVRSREQLVGALSQRADRGIEVFPSSANFILFRCAGAARRIEASRLWSELVERRVLVRDCSGWAGLENCLRVTVGTDDENDRFLAALDDALEALTTAGAPTP